MSYQDSWLWRTAFVEKCDSAPEAEQLYFSSRYFSMREKSAALVGRISTEMKDMTVHDVSHLDALWEMASIVAKDCINLNPPEAFVFGGAVLLHDAAMTIAAYRDGLEGLKREISYGDNYARLKIYFDDNPLHPDAEKIEQIAVSETLRRLHAVQAEVLPTRSWSLEGGAVEFLIDDSEIREFYGPKIGKIATSHWWPIVKLEEQLHNDLGPLGGRTNNRIDLVKIACLLRIADAMHLDRRRAPQFLRKLLNPKGVSASHWAFQARMAVPYVQKEALVYSAAPPFDRQMADAWWLAFDAVTVVDEELRGVERLLTKRGTGTLSVNRVLGITTPQEFSKYVETTGWEPVDSTVRVSDVPKIVTTLGGSKLYGENPLAAIRELIQNAGDAISARRKLQNRGQDWGVIKISFQQVEGVNLLTIEDNGVGMSSRVLTGPLIDFGNSLWRSPLAAEEFPGLQTGGIAATGKYGIGFFSIFMLGSQVKVTSRRYDSAIESLQALEFKNGLSSRPILFRPDTSEAPIDGGTKIEIVLQNDPKIAGFLKPDFHDSKPKQLALVVAALAPNLEVQIDVMQDGILTTVVRPGDWLEMAERNLIGRINRTLPSTNDKNLDSRLRNLVDTAGKIYGRATIETERYGSSGKGCISVGGLRATNISFIRGIVTGREDTASRDKAHPLAPPEVISSWATEQAVLVADARLSGDEKARAAGVIVLLGGAVGDLPLATMDQEWLSKKQLIDYFRSADEVKFHFGELHYDESIDDVHPRDFEADFEEKNGVIFISDGLPGFNTERNIESFLTKFPAEQKGINITQFIINILLDEWSQPVEITEHTEEIGTASGSPIFREVTTYSRAAQSDIAFSASNPPLAQPSSL